MSRQHAAVVLPGWSRGDSTVPQSGSESSPPLTPGCRITVQIAGSHQESRSASAPSRADHTQSPRVWLCSLATAEKSGDEGVWGNYRRDLWCPSAGEIWNWMLGVWGPGACSLRCGLVTILVLKPELN
jgi:hypothetical protein